jgi:hypothetical protein
MKQARPETSLVALYSKFPWYKTMPIDQKINEKYVEKRYRLNVDKDMFGWSNIQLPKTDRS